MSHDDDSDDEEDVEIKQFKIILVGDGAVGKTSIVNRFTNNSFDPDQKYKQTIGLDFFMKKMILNDKMHVSLQIWDIGGQTIGQKMVKNYLKGSDAILFVYDITSIESFSNLEKWMDFVKEAFNESKIIKKPNLILLGNKLDLGYKRTTRLEDHRDFSSKYGMLNSFVSARTGDNIQSTMLKITHDLAGVPLSKTEFESSMSQSTAAIQVFRVNVEAGQGPTATLPDPSSTPMEDATTLHDVATPGGTVGAGGVYLKKTRSSSGSSGGSGSGAKDANPATAPKAKAKAAAASPITPTSTAVAKTTSASAVGGGGGPGVGSRPPSSDSKTNSAPVSPKPSTPSSSSSPTTTTTTSSSSSSTSSSSSDTGKKKKKKKGEEEGCVIL